MGNTITQDQEAQYYEAEQFYNPQYAEEGWIKEVPQDWLGRGPLIVSFPSPPPGIQQNLIKNKNAKKLKRGSLKAQIFTSNSIKISIKTT